MSSAVSRTGTATRRRGASWPQIGLVVLTCAILAGCGTSRAPGGKSGGFATGDGDYRRDGPHANPPANLDAVPDAVPRIEPFASGPNRPYVINGTRYVPETADRPYRASGKASWYGRQFHGRPTSNGETYDMYAMTAAHPTLPIPSYARVTRPDNGRSVIVRINDRGPFIGGRVIDLSYVAAHRLGTLSHGTGDVVVERITHAEIQRGSWPSSPAPAMVATATPVAPRDVPRTDPPPAVARGSIPAGALPAGVGDAPTASMAAAGGGGYAVPATPKQDWASVLAIPVPAAPEPVAPRPAVAVAATPAPTAPVLMTGEAFLQLGAFGEAVNAQQLVDRLRPSVSSLGALQVVRTNDVYRVRLGPFADRNTAVAHVDAVQGQTGIRPHVVAQ